VLKENEDIVGVMRMISCIGKKPEGDSEELEAGNDIISI
jgi:hypothetical protein